MELVERLRWLAAEKFANLDDEGELLVDAADLLEEALKAFPGAIDFLSHYADFIRTDVRADDFERHPYVPAIQDTADTLRDILTKSRGEKIDG